MNFLRLLPVVLSFLLLGAHFYRAGWVAVTCLCVAILFLLFSAVHGAITLRNLFARLYWKAAKTEGQPREVIGAVWDVEPDAGINPKKLKFIKIKYYSNTRQHHISFSYCPLHTKNDDNAVF